MLLRSIRSRLNALVIATVVPFTALIGFGLWIQWQADETAAVQRSLTDARLIASRLDDHIGNLKNLLSGLSVAVSWDAKDTAANDALLRRIKAELPPYVANLMLFSLEGQNIGTSSDKGRYFAGDRRYFRGIIEGQRLAVGDVVRSRVGREWVVTIARAVEDREGRLRAVLAVGTRLERFQAALSIKNMPADTALRIIDEKRIIIAQSVAGPSRIGSLSRAPDEARHAAAREISHVERWSDGVARITGSASAEQVPWLVSVGLPADVALAAVMWRLGWGLAFTLAALALALATAWILSGRIVHPLRQLGRDAAILAAGDLTHRSRVQTSDELGLLAEAFNQMAQALQQREDDARHAADDLKSAKDTLSAVIDASPVAIVCSDVDRRVFLWNPAAERIFGYTAREAIGRHARDMPPLPGPPESIGLVGRALKGEIVRDLNLKRLRKDGTVVDVRAAAAAMYHSDGTVRGVARAYEDITERMRAEEQLKRIAHYDQLTGLPNRLTLQKELGRRLSGEGKSTSVVLFDLDGFKDVNDTLGHSTGDQLLIEVGQRLVEVVSGQGQVCRLGGDEFVVIIPDCADPVIVGRLVDTMLKQIAEPYQIGDHSLHIGGSAGIAISPSDGTSVDELIANADLALYQAKAAGRRAYRFFLPVLRAQAHARRSLDLELRRAYQENEFELYFQPQVRLADGAVVGAEALLRWRHPVAGIMSPGAFIDTLAGSAIAPQVSRWIIRTACARAAEWRARGLPLARMAINLFPSQLGDGTLLRDLDEALRDTDLPPEALELEITENVALDFQDVPILQKIHDRGIKLAFDDFGTGYASLSYLTRFPLSRIKIDRSFVGKITNDAGDAAIVRSLIAMAHNLGLEVIAEGVETTDQAAFLLDEACEEAQGFLYSKPLPADGFETYLASRPIGHAQDAPARRISREPAFARRGGKTRRAPV